ncbi:hypothetical protein AB0F59_27630 [Micromonospora lupini]|uniref:hypothetical protein n=1 Tax=Micromonospora lupini TaxID=285679 RepID=UPI0033E215D3
MATVALSKLWINRRASRRHQWTGFFKPGSQTGLALPVRFFYPVMKVQTMIHNRRFDHGHHRGSATGGHGRSAGGCR